MKKSEASYLKKYPGQLPLTSKQIEKFNKFQNKKLTLLKKHNDLLQRHTTLLSAIQKEDPKFIAERIRKNPAKYSEIMAAQKAKAERVYSAAMQRSISPYQTQQRIGQNLNPYGMVYPHALQGPHGGSKRIIKSKKSNKLNQKSKKSHKI